MNNTKKFLRMALCLIMVLSLALPAVPVKAEDATYILTINNDKEGHVYEAYQIFSGTLADMGETQILSDIEWGSAIVKEGESGYDKSAELLAAIKEESRLSVLHSATDATSMAALLAGVTSDSETLDLFAEVVGQYLGNYAGQSTEEVSPYKIAGLPAGYYLVKDKDGSLQGENDVYTKFIIRVLKSVAVTPKGDIPTVEKQINDTIDGTFTNTEDFDINDTAYYKWEGTLPSNLKSYAKYFYKFVDTLPTGVDFLDFQQIYIEGHDGNVVHVFYDITDTVDTNNELPEGIEKNVNEKNITLTFDDLLTLYPNILPTQKIIVKYTARITRDALIAKPMTNSVTLEYSNNPNGAGVGETGTTPKDVAHAFTFRINVDKYDADNTTKKLEGAEFVLYYERTENDATVKYYAKVITEEMIEENQVINGTVVDENDLGVVYEWTTDKDEASILDTDKKGQLSIRGLDGGIYYLEETKAPVGYNLMETPVQIKIVPAYTETGDEASVEVSYEVDSIAQTSDTVGVRNSSGSTLPITGGIGTTIFYVMGGIMVVGAVVLLVTKKRMSA